jgi:hypothetical protein
LVSLVAVFFLLLPVQLPAASAHAAWSDGRGRRSAKPNTPLQRRRCFPDM